MSLVQSYKIALWRSRVMRFERELDKATKRMAEAEWEAVFAKKQLDEAHAMLADAESREPREEGRER